MGTTASTAQQTVSAGAPFEGLQGGSSMDGQHSPSVHAFQTTSLHNSKAKSIIPNKVAPVVITYNCREEFQIHDELLKAHYTLGRLSDATPEHYLVQGRYFLVRDVTEKMDVLGTVQSCGAPNFRQVQNGLPVFGMGQPTLSGFRRVLQKLQKDGHRECLIFCVREEPVLFLRAGDDFVPYTPRDKQNLRENLQGLGPGIQAESLELAIRKEIHDFAQLSENTYHVYHDIEDLLGAPRAVAIRGEDDVHVTEEVFKRPLFLQPSYRYHRLPLPEQGAPLEAQFDAFVSVLRETPSLLPLRDAHGPPPALLFSCQTGVGRTNLGMTLGTLILFHHSRAASRPEAVPLQTKTLPMEQLRLIQSFLHVVPQGRKMVDEVSEGAGGKGVGRGALSPPVLGSLPPRRCPLQGKPFFPFSSCPSPPSFPGPPPSLPPSPLPAALPSPLPWSGHQVDRAITACAEMHDLKEVLLENQRKLEGVRPDSPAQGSSSQHDVRQRALQSLERYFYLILFNYYLHEQYPLAFALSFSRWLCAHPELYRLPVTLSSAGPVAPEDLLTKGSLRADDLISPDALGTVREMDVANFRRVPRMPIYGTAQPSTKALGSILAYLTDAKRKLQHVVWVNLREEAVLECDGHTHSLRWPGPPMDSDQLEHLEIQLKAHLSAPVPGTGAPPACRFQTCLTTQEVFAQHRKAHPGLTYHHIPVPDFCAPHEEGFPEVGEEELVSVPDAKFTKGEFEVVMKVVQLLPAGHRVKKEVDAALDTVSETMTPMHYHLREIIICTYRQARAAKSEPEAQRLQLRSLQYLERYIYLVLFNAYLHLEKADSWQRPFSAWMRQVASKAGVYEILNELGFPELESARDPPFSRLRCRWQEQSHLEPSAAGDFL
uniref:Paladin n=1 Tax=Suricata suricatta TaxID=37032 RepID=A0A673V807_SURSU